MSHYVRVRDPEIQPHLLQVTDGGERHDFIIELAGSHEFPRSTGRFKVNSREHTHDVYHVVLYTSGSGSFLLNGKSHSCRRGTLVVTSPGEPHEFFYCCVEDRTYWELAFYLGNPNDRPHWPIDELLSYYVGAKLFQVDYPVQLSDALCTRLSELLRNLTHRLLEQSEMALFVANKAALEILAFLADETHGCRIDEDHQLNIDVLRAKEELERRYTEHLSVASLAEIACLSPGHFGRAFRNAFKVTPIAYQRELRIQSAKNLLCNTGLLCKEIAVRTGFDDVYLFFKTFKRIVGMTPMEFREKHRQRNE